MNKIVLSLYDWIYGITQIAATLLSIAAGGLAINAYENARKNKTQNSWKYLSIALILFTLEEIFGGLKIFGIYKTEYITHIIPTLILALLIVALHKQINITKGLIE